MSKKFKIFFKKYTFEQKSQFKCFNYILDYIIVKQILLNVLDSNWTWLPLSYQNIYIDFFKKNWNEKSVIKIVIKKKP